MRLIEQTQLYFEKRSGTRFDSACVTGHVTSSADRALRVRLRTVVMLTIVTRFIGIHIIYGVPLPVVTFIRFKPNDGNQNVLVTIGVNLLFPGLRTAHLLGKVSFDHVMPMPWSDTQPTGCHGYDVRDS